MDLARAVVLRPGMNHEEKEDETHCIIGVRPDNANWALRLASYGYIMGNGKIVLDRPKDDLMHKEDVKASYLRSVRYGARSRVLNPISAASASCNRESR